MLRTIQKIHRAMLLEAKEGKMKRELQYAPYCLCNSCTEFRIKKKKLTDVVWIYESPDNGKTVFRRPFGDYDAPREKVVTQSYDKNRESILR